MLELAHSVFRVNPVKTGLVILLVIIVKTVFRAAERMFTLPAVTNKESALLAREMLMCADANSVIQRCVSHEPSGL